MSLAIHNKLWTHTHKILNLSQWFAHGFLSIHPPYCAHQHNEVVIFVKHVLDSRNDKQSTFLWVLIMSMLTNLIKKLSWSLVRLAFKDFDSHLLATGKLPIEYWTKPAFSNLCLEVLTCNNQLLESKSFCTYTKKLSLSHKFAPHS